MTLEWVIERLHNIKMREVSLLKKDISGKVQMYIQLLKDIQKD